MIYIKLLFSFIKIGLFTFGGGYAMIPLIQKEIEINGWLTPSQFVDIIAIAEITPGPIAINSATFVGYKAAGVFGGLVATFGVSLPPLILMLIVSKYFVKFMNHPLNSSIFYFIRPVVAGLIFVASVYVAQTTLFTQSITLNDIGALLKSPFSFIDFRSILILVLTIISIKKFKINPILVIVGSGVLGGLLYI